MHLLLTDRLTCPRCGPEFGLVLRADHIEDRRVLEGFLGCPNCREKYPIEHAVADLRPPPRRPMTESDLGAGRARPGLGPDLPPDPDETVRLAALLGVTEGPGTVVVAGEVTGLASSLAELLSGVEVVALDERATPLGAAGVSRLVTGHGIPFYSGTIRAVALRGSWAEALIDEAVRAVARLGRVVLFNATDGAADRFRGQELEVLLDEGGTLVGQRG